MTEPNIILPPGDAPLLSENALTVLQSRYLIKDEFGKCIETPAQLLSRVALLVARAETQYGASPDEVKQWHKTYYDLMAQLQFLPNSPTLMNAGRQGMLSACFVLPIEDSIEGIFETIKHTALIQKAGGGTGFSLDKLRPAGDRIESSGGTTSGPISFWRVFSEATNAIQQGAFRRGANMGMMSIGHPDILKFLHAKQNLTAFTNFNISVKIS
ncbi:MAG: ribonucleotide reductase N-terminal alpha domain-containing protein, partial [Phycisphaerae bacterium]